jgi:23S rRNA (guanosine2251-2'-O)-methyltransferase
VKERFRRAGPAPRRDAGDEEETVSIWGLHAVEAALANPTRPIIGLWVTENAANRLARGIADRGVAPERVLPRDLDRRLGADTVHQGVLLEAGPLPEADLLDLAGMAIAKGPLVVLDQVTDPHNVGAVLRSAAVFGSAGVVMTRRNSPPLGGALAKAASGALELIPVALVQNLARALAELADAGVLVIGLDGDASELLEDRLLGGGPVRPSALVLGAEGRGLRQLTRETCSQLCRISGEGGLKSLNVSNAAAVALHLAAMARRRNRPPA